jgi:hypothetical protein
MRFCVPSLVVLALWGLALGVSRGVAQEDKKEEDKKEPAKPDDLPNVPADILQKIDTADIKKLVKDLEKASHIDRRGQQLLKGKAKLTAALVAAKRVQDRFAASPETVAALKLLQGDARAQARLKQILGMPSGKPQSQEYTRFLKDFEIQHDWVAGAFNLHNASLMVAETEEGLKLINEEIANHEKKSRPSVTVALESGGPQSLEEIRGILKQLELKGSARPVSVPDAVPDTQNLDFLRAFVNPPKK